MNLELYRKVEFVALMSDEAYIYIYITIMYVTNLCVL